jgi:hypothetical protein
MPRQLSAASRSEHNGLAADGVDVGYAAAKAAFIAAIWAMKAPGFDDAPESIKLVGSWFEGRIVEQRIRCFCVRCLSLKNLA